MMAATMATVPGRLATVIFVYVPSPLGTYSTSSRWHVTLINGGWNSISGSMLS